jgi:polysaccharide biosynthesis protein PslH
LNQRQSLRLEVIGRNPTPSVAGAEGGRVRFSGFVDDLQARVQRAAVFIVPLRVGSGTRLKILEAMAMGKAIVSTRIGAEGIGLVDGDSACLVDTPVEFARAIDRLLGDPELRHRLGQRARLLAEQDYAWTMIGKRLLATYESLLQVQSNPGNSAERTHRQETLPTCSPPEHRKHQQC